MAVQPLSAASAPSITLTPLPTALLALLLPLLAYIAYALHALLAAQRAHTASLAAATDAVRALHQPLSAAKHAVDAQARTTAAVDRVSSLIEARWPENGSASDPHSVGGRRGSAGSAAARSQAEEDADLYRRKVEAMEGLRRLMEAQPAPLVEDKDLYRRRVEALEGLRRVLEMQPSVEAFKAASVGTKKGARDGRTLAGALSVKSEGRALRRERSGETLGESLLDL
ncbi:hypothetical protein MPH_12883 [Macrophomina phaseolina MS6]|uniref:Uncharacterized protein n=2 Tax=Macrophomina phaseolina TaxID=35725 RepID=K2RIU0_MACPH|nr:hypothetical protein MPH_12883 [Macrophomina phaseolina MS6]